MSTPVGYQPVKRHPDWARRLLWLQAALVGACLSTSAAYVLGNGGSEWKTATLTLAVASVICTVARTAVRVLARGNAQIEQATKGIGDQS